MSPQLRTDLSSNCGGWPQRKWSPTNNVPRGLLEAGSLAVDFTLRDINGHPHTLSDLLAARPVLMVLGAYT